ncbi:roadblock/LC7 domain-containing protein [Streptomyces sp. NPDC060194]|uniref:roadblock/LC7 domain-containing protein n=1 Tax=Streptomyces sp. NPDC060194 TaxID=3347069 RepID=UPI00365F390E
MIRQLGNMDWMLKDLSQSAQGILQIVVLSADGLRIARHGGDPDGADRVAAACAGLQSLAAAVAAELPYGEGVMRMVVIEMDAGFFYLMAVAPGSYVAVLTDETADSARIGAAMRDMVARIGENLASPPRHDGKAG